MPGTHSSRLSDSRQAILKHTGKVLWVQYKTSWGMKKHHSTL